MTGTISLTSQGTVALDLTTYGTVTVASPIRGTFIAGAIDPIFVIEGEQVSATIAGGDWTAVNSFGYLDLNSVTPLAINTDTVNPQSSGSTTTLGYNSFGYLNGEVFARNFQDTGAAFQMSYGSNGTLVTQDTIAALGTFLPFAPSPNYLFTKSGDVGLVVDPQGILFDSATGSYTTASFFPTMNASPPPTASSFDGGYANTVSGHNYLAVTQFETVYPYAQLPSFIEETNQGAPVAVYTYAFNDSVNVPGDVYNIAGNTPTGFYFTTDTGIVEVSPSLQQYTVYEFAPQDTGASACLDVVLFREGLYNATKDSVGAWWLSNSANDSTSATDFIFATTSAPTPPPPTPTDCCVPLPSPTLGRWRGNAGLNCYGKTLIGDAFSGVIGFADFNNFQEYGNTMRGQVSAPPIHSNRRRIFMPRFEIDIESGVGATECCGFDPTWVLDWSKDGGRTWSEVAIPRSMGKLGEYTQRLRWLRLGQARQWVMRLTSTDPVRRVIIGTYVDTYEGMG